MAVLRRRKLQKRKWGERQEKEEISKERGSRSRIMCHWIALSDMYLDNPCMHSLLPFYNHPVSTPRQSLLLTDGST
jgi:hypothetical protein